MDKMHGRTIPISWPRRFVCDLVHFGRKQPTVTVQKTMDLLGLKKERELSLAPPSWCAIFTKAYSQVTMEFPQLRWAHLSWPWRRFYEHPNTTASVAVEREWRGENIVLFVHLRSPHVKTLLELDEHLRQYKTVSVEQISWFRRARMVSRFPLPIRRFLWWSTLEWSGAKRAKRLGTFGVSVYSGLGASSLNPISPLTSTINYGVIGEDGRVDVRIMYDHRVMDGATVARALQRMETILQETICAEIAKTNLNKKDLDFGVTDERCKSLAG